LTKGAYHRSVQHRKPVTVQSHAKTLSDCADPRRVTETVRGVGYEYLAVEIFEDPQRRADPPLVLASRENHMAIHLVGCYGDDQARAEVRSRVQEIREED
jgi:hypothetical protein